MHFNVDARLKKFRNAPQWLSKSSPIGNSYVSRTRNSRPTGDPPAQIRRDTSGWRVSSSRLLFLVNSYFPPFCRPSHDRVPLGGHELHRDEIRISGSLDIYVLGVWLARRADQEFSSSHREISASLHTSRRGAVRSSEASQMMPGCFTRTVGPRFSRGFQRKCVNSNYFPERRFAHALDRCPPWLSVIIVGTEK